MANTFAEKVAKFSTYLDEKYQKEALTGMLEVPAKLVEWIGTRTVKYPEIDMTGLATYDRSAGFTKGGVSLSWGTLELKHDRGREFQIDVMDNDELAFTAFGNLVEQFIRTRVVPEIDAVRFATLAGYAKSANVVEFDAATAKPFKMLDELETAFIDNEAGMEGVVLFVSTAFYAAMKQSPEFQRQIDQIPYDGEIKNYIGMWNDVPVIKVPKTRFVTAVELLKGAAADAATVAGWQTAPAQATTDAEHVGIAGAGKEISFLAVKLDNKKYGLTKHAVLRYFAPDVNQDADAHKVQYRIFHDLVCTNEGAKSIYLATKK